ncbi:MAG TPA: autotransporter-associated beta strand repeat-containing protein [Ramlibacter sp.]|uniref:two-partner secretion domain-containing protein n=1 Tax=Ramlibacter sp. TaxID=1917967 RepID=UPI002ED4069A
MKPQATHRLQVRTVIVRISRKLKATYRVRRGRLFSDLLVAMLTVFSPLARALPDTATMNVAAGQVTVDPKSTSNSLVLNQGTNKAILDWRSFNIGTGESVRFVQPGTSSVALNRISGGATSIYGALSANGQVFLVNPAGVLFAPGAQVNVGGLVATTLDLSNNDFLNGKYTFSGSSTASVTNQGSLAGRYVVLAGASVNNAGTIDAQRGSVGLLAGSRVTVDPSGAGLVKFSVDTAAVNAAIVNSGTITADGGQVALLASALSDTLPTVINQSGVIRANSIADQNGTIVLSGGSTGIVQVSGTLEAKGANAGESGGTVRVLGDRVGLMAGAKVDASGDAGGGTVLVGGNFQGKGAEQNATVTVVQQGASVDASAGTSGHGGKVIVWADDTTTYAGDIKATGGSVGGNGGFAEVSGKKSLGFAGTANLSAPKGTAGTLLLDPDNIIVANGGGAAFPTNTTFAANAGTTQTIDAQTIEAVAGSVTLQATNDITFNEAINKGNGGLTAMAGNDINVNANIGTGANALFLDANYSSLPFPLSPTGTGKVTVGAGVTLSGSVVSVSSGFSAGTNVINGTIVATNAVNFFGGNASINAGSFVSAPTLNVNVQSGKTVTLGASNRIGDSTNLTVASGTLAIGVSSDTVGAVSLTGGSITGTGGSLTASNFDVQSGSISANLAGTGGLTKSTAGTVTLSGANTYTGGTTVGGGRLVSSNSVLPSGNVSIASGAVLQFDNQTGGLLAVKPGTYTGTGTLRFSGNAGSNTALGGGGGNVNISLGSGGLVDVVSGRVAGSSTDQGFWIGNLANLNIASGAIFDGVEGTIRVNALNGAGSLQGGWPGRGSVTVGVDNGSGTFTGTLSNNTSGGVLSLGKTGSGTQILAGTSTYTGTTNITGGTLQIGNGGTTGTLGTNTVTVNGGTLAINRSDAVTIANTITGTGGLTQAGTGTTTLTGNNNYSGATSVNGGTLALGGTAILDTGTVNLNGGDLALTGSETIGSVNGGGNISLGSHTLTVGGGDLHSNPTGVISGTGGLTKIGAGVLTLAAVNTYSGPTTVLGGALQASGDQIADASAVTVGAGAEWWVNGSGTVGSIAGAGSINLNWNTLTVGGTNSSTTFSGTISGGGGLTKAGTGSLTLSGANTYGGATTVAAGTLALGHPSATLSDSTAVSVATGASLDLGANSDTVGSLTLNGTLAGTGTLAAGSYTLDGATVDANLGTGTLTQAGGTSTLNGTALAGTVNVDGGTLVLGPTDYRLNAVSTLTIAAGATLNTGTALQSFGTAPIANSGTLVTGGTLFAGSISGPGSASLGGNVHTSGSQAYGGPVALTADVTITGAGVTFGSTVTGAQALIVSTTGGTATTFNGAVNVAALTTDADGSTVVNGGSVTTTGLQNFYDAVVLGGNTTFDAGASELAFNGGVDGAFALTATGSGITRINTAVGSVTPLTSLTTNGGGFTFIEANVTTSGTQAYNDAVVLLRDATLTGTDVTFARIDGSQALTLNASGLTTFGGIVNIGSLVTDAAGSTVVNGGSVATSGAQTFNEAVVLGANTNFSAGTGAIAFNGTVDGAFAMTATTSGATSFNAAVGSGTALASLSVNGGGTTSIAADVTTTGGQNYSDAITLAAPAITVTSTGGGNIGFSTTVDGNTDLAINTAGITRLFGTVGGGTALASLTTDAGGSSRIGTNVTTTGAQTYNDAVVLTANTALNAGTGTIAFGGTVNGAFALSATASGTTSFAGAVGGGTALASLTTNGGGTTQLSGSVRTTGVQSMEDVVLGGNVALTSTGNQAITVGNVTGGGNDLGFTSTGGASAGTIAGVGVLTLGSGTNLAATSVAAAGGNLAGNVTTTGSQSYTGPLQTAAGTTLTATGSLVATDVGNVIGSGTQFAVTQDGGGTGTLAVAGDFTGAVQVSGNATSVSLDDRSAATQLVVSGLSAAPTADVTLVGAGAMQVDAAALSPVANLSATTQNGNLVFLNSGTAQAGSPGVLATTALTLNVTGGALNSAADPMVINAGTPVVNIAAAPAYTQWLRPVPAPAPAPAVTTASDALLRQAEDVAGTLEAQVDALIATDVRNAAGLLHTERLVFFGRLTPSAVAAPLSFRTLSIRLPRCFSEQQKAEPGCR